LDFVLNQQTELSQILDQLEKSVAADEYSGYSTSMYPHHADTQRERM